MSSLNKVILIGNIGKAPEVLFSKTGKKYAKFSVATTTKKKDESGQYIDHTEWHNIVLLNEKLVEVVEKYLTKGSKVYIEGQIKYDDYTDKDGIKRRATSIQVSGFNSQLILLNSKASSEETTQSSAPTQGSNNSSGNFIEDDDVPF